MTAEPVLANVAAPESVARSSPRRTIADEGYAGQLDRRLASDRKSGSNPAPAVRAAERPSDENAPGTAVQTHESGAPGETSSSIGLPESLSKSTDSEDVIPASERSDESSPSVPVSSLHSSQIIVAAPPVPWRQFDAVATNPTHEVSSEGREEPLPKPPASSEITTIDAGSPDGSIPTGFPHATAVVTSKPDRITAPPGLAVAFDAVQKRSTGHVVEDVGADGLAQLAGTPANGNPQDGLPKTAPSELPVEPSADTSAVSVVAGADAALVETSSAVGVTQAAPGPLSAPQVSAAADETLSEDSAVEDGAVGDETAPASVTENDDVAIASKGETRSGGHERQGGERGRDHATGIVANGTARTVAAIENAAEAPSAERKIAPSHPAIPAELHQAIANRAADAITDLPEAQSSDGATRLSPEGVASAVRQDAKAHPPSPGQSVRGDQTSTADLAEGLPRHAAAALRAAAGFDRPIRIRLSPADLGAMQVEVSRQQGSLAARFEVTTSAAQSMLNEHLPALRESLGRSGLTIDRVEVRLVESTPDDNRPEGRQGDERQGRGHQHQEHRRQDEWFDADAADEAVPQRRTTSTITPQVTRSARGAAADLIDIQV